MDVTASPAPAGLFLFIVLFIPTPSMDFYTMEDVILRSKVMEQLDETDGFDMIFVTADRKRGTGGELVEVRDWQKMDGNTPTERMPGRNRKPATAMKKDPNHWENKTINIFNPANLQQHPIKVHYRLIQFFNRQRVING